ncbi:hypothetical protein WN944_004234 [Citrus x changshan-huyou]|uniref:Uncharacterized protein n=1 Tax=Citrus x changshan-huyou TaxID=2935761 RepID=A0AAP0M2U0_9ROSI
MKAMFRLCFTAQSADSMAFSKEDMRYKQFLMR